MVRRKLTCVGARGGNVYKWCRWPEKKKPDEKKIGIDQGAGSLGTDRRTEKEKREKGHKDRHQWDREKRKRKRKRQRKKKVEKKEIYKGRNTHSPSPTALEYKKKKDLLD